MLRKALIAMVACVCCLGMAVPAMADANSSDHRIRITTQKEGNAVLIQAYCKNVSSRSRSASYEFFAIRKDDSGNESVSRMKGNLDLGSGEERKTGTAIISPPITEIKVRILEGGKVVAEEIVHPEQGEDI